MKHDSASMVILRVAFQRIALSILLAFALLVTGAPASAADLIHKWNFDGNANDSVGTAHGTLYNGATISGGKLVLDGVNDYVQTSDIADAPITDMTLVAWVALPNLTQRQGGVISLNNYNGVDVFDAIVYGEKTAYQWMNGSDGFSRTPYTSNGGANETQTTTVMIAITYNNKVITIYRNGSQYANPISVATEPSYPGSGRTAAFLFGVRHEDLKGGTGTATGNDQFLCGSIDEARAYRGALTAAEVAALYAAGPAPANVSPTIANQSFSVNENSANGTVVGTVVASDQDAGQTLAYSITAGDSAGIFAINSATGQITVANSSLLDFESTPSSALTVRVVDNGSPALENNATVTVNLANVNESPMDITLSNNSVIENQPVETFVGTLSASDVDAGDTATFALVTGVGSDDNASFSIDGTALKTAAAFDYETKSSYSIRVQVTDAGNLTYEKQFTLQVSDLNEAPTDLALSASNLAENSASGTAVGSLSATDPDAGDTATFTLVSGTGSDDNANFSIDGTTFKTAAIFDYETKNSYSIRVQVTDAGGFTYEKSFAIAISDVNDMPPAIANMAPTDITINSATMSGELTFPISAPAIPTTVLVYWGTSDGQNDASAWAYTNSFAPVDAAGVLSTNITGLSETT